MPISEKSIYVVIAVKTGWYDYDYLLKCEAWITSILIFELPIIIGVYDDEFAAKRIVQLLQESRSSRTIGKVFIYYQKMTESRFQEVCTEQQKKLSNMNYQFMHPDNFKPNHIYCNGSWINAYELNSQIERCDMHKTKNVDICNNYNDNNYNDNYYSDNNIIDHYLIFNDFAP